MRQLLTGLFLLLLATRLYAEPLPDFHANYQVELNGIQAGELKQTLTTDEAGQRKFVSKTQAKGIFAFIKPDIIEETSLWVYHQDKIRPMFYRYSRDGGKKDKTLTMDFYWNKLKVHIDDREQPWDLKLKRNTLDKLVYQLQVMHDLENNRDKLTYTIADGGKLKKYEIIRLGEEIIDTPLGKIAAVKLTRERDADSDRKTTLWCAPELGYLPVKLEHIEKDDSRFTAYLRKLEGIPTDVFQPEVTANVTQ
ncbi:DUF3108 domain-containing protein [Methylophaga sp. OBS3]|uniref:DUF3108 domain-containing protein n=1 Tax=Methylophaga sp. OBS3 TaxID=2991934 RepID=UPI002257E238|nr:DUF3108 domain-containing protein [Methylophaga sp. OBS3]MCX4189303.1 DUF3108 domain-containing protein [Methylophaga sp. OBS3]